MKAMLAAFIASLIFLSSAAEAQILRYEPTKVEGQKAIRLITARNNVYLAVGGTIEGEDGLILVVGHRHALDYCVGALAVTKTRIIYKSQLRPDHNFIFPRSELQEAEVNDWKSFGKVVYRQLTVKSKKKDYNFYPWAESAVYNLNTEDYPFILDWFGAAISNFDERWRKFQETYESNTPQNTLISPEGKMLTIRERYDKFKDRTVFATSPMPVKGTHLSILFQAAFWSEGTEPSIPKNATIYIDADDTVRRLFKGDRTLIFLIDGQRFKLGEMDWLDSTYIPGGRYYSGSVIDELGIVIPWEMLVKIADGTSVEFQVGTVEGALDDSHRTLLKKLIDRAGSGAAKPSARQPENPPSQPPTKSS